jgi:transcriptional regulator with XRE-family HTH domain
MKQYLANLTMQKPSKRHVLALVRIQAGLTQKELAKLLGVRPITVQSIEQGALKLSEELALKAESELDVAAAWLLANDPKIAPYTVRNSKWNRDLFEFRQGSRYAVSEQRSKKGSRAVMWNPNLAAVEIADEFTAWRAAHIAAEFDNLLRGSKGLPRQGILLRRIYRALEELKKDFPAAPTRESYAARIAQLESAYEARSKALWEAEKEELWRSENQAKPSPGSKASK